MDFGSILEVQKRPKSNQNHKKTIYVDLCRFVFDFSDFGSIFVGFRPNFKQFAVDLTSHLLDFRQGFYEARLRTKLSASSEEPSFEEPSLED